MIIDNIQIDAGNSVIDMTYDRTNRSGIIVTAYVNGLSVRTNYIKLDRIVQSFIDSVLAACDVNPDSDKANRARITLEIRQFIDSVRAGG